MRVLLLMQYRRSLQPYFLYLRHCRCHFRPRRVPEHLHLVSGRLLRVSDHLHPVSGRLLPVSGRLLPVSGRLLPVSGRLLVVRQIK